MDHTATVQEVTAPAQASSKALRTRLDDIGAYNKEALVVASAVAAAAAKARATLDAAAPLATDRDRSSRATITPSTSAALVNTPRPPPVLPPTDRE